MRACLPACDMYHTHTGPKFGTLKVHIGQTSDLWRSYPWSLQVELALRFATETLNNACALFNDKADKADVKVRLEPGLNPPSSLNPKPQWPTLTSMSRPSLPKLGTRSSSFLASKQKVSSTGTSGLRESCIKSSGGARFGVYPKPSPEPLQVSPPALIPNSNPLLLLLPLSSPIPNTFKLFGFFYFSSNLKV